MNQKDLIWDLAIKNSNSIETDNLCEVTSIKFTKEDVNNFVFDLFSAFREELRNHYINDPRAAEYDLAVSDCIGETFVFTGEVE